VVEFERTPSGLRYVRVRERRDQQQGEKRKTSFVHLDLLGWARSLAGRREGEKWETRGQGDAGTGRRGDAETRRCHRVSPSPRHRVTRSPRLDWSVVDPTQLLHPTIVDRSLHDLVPQQRKHSSTEKQRPRVSIPIDARRTAGIVDRFLGLRSEFSDFAELQ